MGDIISSFERRINRINVLYGLIIPVSLMTVVAFIIRTVEPGYFQANSLWIHLGIITSVAVIFLIHLRRIDRLNHSQLQLIYSYYHLALIVFCLLVAPIRSPFVFLWVLLAIGMDIVFKRYWMYLTIIIYGLTTAASAIRESANFSHDFWPLVAQFIGVTTTAVLVSKYRSISDEERRSLDSTSRSSAFERQRLLSLINNMGEAVIATDQRGKILLYNAAVLNLLDTNASLEGRLLDSVLNLHDKNKRRIKVMNLLKQQPAGVSSTDYSHTFTQNDNISVYLNVAPIKLGFKEHSQSGFIAILRDITREKSLEDERDEFISVISHELRTPVAIAEGNISNAVFMAKKHHSPAVVADALAQSHDKVIFLANMINDIATLSRAERSNVALELSTVDPRDLIHGLARDYDTDAAAKHLKLTASAAKDCQPIVTSPLYLQEILQNFVTNAIKYTKKGSVIVHVRSDKAGNAVFSVADSGIGLSKSDQKRVFDKFFRSEDYRTRESNGTGLGLYVTAKLAKRISAKIEISSELNKGSTFTVTVPSLQKAHHLRRKH